MAEMRSIEGALFTTDEGVLWGEYRMDHCGQGGPSGWDSTSSCCNIIEESSEYCGSKFNGCDNWSTWELPNYEKCEVVDAVYTEGWGLYQLPDRSEEIYRSVESCGGNDTGRIIETGGDKEVSDVVWPQQEEIGRFLLCPELVESEDEGRSEMESMPTCGSIIGTRYPDSVVVEQKFVKRKKAQAKTTLDLWTTQLWKKHAFDGVRWKIESPVDAERGRFHGYVGRWKLRPSGNRRIQRTKETDVYERISGRCAVMLTSEGESKDEKTEYPCYSVQ